MARKRVTQTVSQKVVEVEDEEEDFVAPPSTSENDCDGDSDSDSENDSENDMDYNNDDNEDEDEDEDEDNAGPRADDSGSESSSSADLPVVQPATPTKRQKKAHASRKRAVAAKQTKKRRIAVSKTDYGNLLILGKKRKREIARLEQAVIEDLSQMYSMEQLENAIALKRHPAKHRKTSETDRASYDSDGDCCNDDDDDDDDDDDSDDDNDAADNDEQMRIMEDIIKRCTAESFPCSEDSAVASLTSKKKKRHARFNEIDSADVDVFEKEDSNRTTSVNIKHLVKYPQDLAAERLGISASKLSRAWKRKFPNRRWPYRTLLTIKSRMEQLQLQQDDQEDQLKQYSGQRDGEKYIEKQIENSRKQIMDLRATRDKLSTGYMAVNSPMLEKRGGNIVGLL